MTQIDDFLEPLNHGIWEVGIPKDEVTEPLGDRWIKSRINIPTPGTIASYRNGQYHLHETRTEWRVHLDRYDPTVHPILHLIDDAPLFLMISDTILMLFSEVRGRSVNTRDKLQDQERVLSRSFYLGFFLVLLGLTCIVSPKAVYFSILQLILPLAVIVSGMVSIFTNMTWHPVRVSDPKKLLTGGTILLVGIILGFFPMNVWNLILIVVLGTWMLASAIMLLNRVRKGKSAIPEGFYSRFAIAVISLSLVIVIFYVPAAILALFMIIAGLIIILLGCTMISAAYRLKQVSHPYPQGRIQE